MKKKNGDIMRIESVIESDRLSMPPDFEGIIKRDIKSLLLDYFDLTSPITFEVVKDGKDYFLTIKCSAGRIKPFGVLPK